MSGSSSVTRRRRRDRGSGENDGSCPSNRMETQRRRRLVKEPTIDPERLAALLDGRLDERARSEILAQLAASEADLEVMADAAAVMREMEMAETLVAADAVGAPSATPPVE